MEDRNAKGSIDELTRLALKYPPPDDYRPETPDQDQRQEPEGQIDLRRAACTCLEEVAAKQRRCWLIMLLWWLDAIVFLVITTQLMSNVSFTFIQVVLYGSFLSSGYFSMRNIARVRCPHCHKPAGAVWLFRYRFLICRSCGERIECEPRGQTIGKT